MSNVVFLIGNGFDISLGFKTSFSDFFYSKTFKLGIVGKYNTNKFNQLHKLLKQSIDNGGLDNSWSDFEIKMGELTQKYIGYNNIFDYTMDFTLFTSLFQMYLFKLQQKQSKTKIKQTVKYLRNTWGENCEKLNEYLPIDGTENKVNFITFNYTDILDNIILEYNNRCKVLHIHGSVNTYPILGIDNAGLIKNEEFKNNSQFCNTFIKDNLRNNYFSQTFIESKKLVENADLIFAYGLSVGKADATYWSMIKEMLLESLDKKLCINVYIDKSTSNCLQYMRQIRRDFFTVTSATKCQKKALRKQIICIPNSPIFTLKQNL